MTPEELAHWIYREAAIQRELQYLKAERKKYLEWDNRSKAAQVKELTDPEHIRAIHRVETRLVRWAKDIDPFIETNEYLLEEARYKIALGKAVGLSI
jgi:hypothetical protein